MFENRIKHLQEMHSALDKQIDRMESTGAFDDQNLSNLKKRRLQIRDQIERLRCQQDRDFVETNDE